MRGGLDYFMTEPFFDPPLRYWEKDVLTTEFDWVQDGEVWHGTMRRDPDNENDDYSDQIPWG